MLTRFHTLLIRAGVAPDLAATLVARVVASRPGGSDVAALDSATDPQLALLSASVAATHVQECSAALPPLLAYLGGALRSLSASDHGRFWYLQGVTALRLEQDLPGATRALHQSLLLLHGTTSPEAQALRAQVYDILGQVLQHQGRRSEARQAWEQALQERDPADAEGMARTLGMLGEVCLDLGDAARATEYFARALTMVTHHTPARLSTRAQLLAHLGTCALERGGLTAARTYFQQSKRLAQAEGSASGLAMAALGLGLRAVRCGKMVTAQRQVQEARRQLDATRLSEPVANNLRGLLSQLVAEIHLAQQRPAEAVEAFTAARQLWARASGVSPVAQARLLYGLARASLQHGEPAHAVSCLREALQVLEPAGATALRQEMTHALRAHAPDA